MRLTNIRRDCLQCETAFNIPYYNRKQKFCCPRCSQEHRRQTPRNVLCKGCGSTLTNQNNRFCSKSCSASFNNRRRTNLSTRKCLNCSGDLTGKYAANIKFCSLKCFNEHKWAEVTLPAVEKGEVTTSPTLRKYLSQKRGYKCERCGIHKWDGDTLMLQVDHIDGNPDNNLPCNLRLLCPNCHSLTPTYKGSNKKSLKMAKRNVMHRAIYATNKSHHEITNGAPDP